MKSGQRFDMRRPATEGKPDRPIEHDDVWIDHRTQRDDDHGDVVDHPGDDVGRDRIASIRGLKQIL